jgi:hypothetical protein
MPATTVVSKKSEVKDDTIPLEPELKNFHNILYTGMDRFVLLVSAIIKGRAM